ncbi:MAG: acylphosphatase [Ornithinimicrobium sp.]
MHPDAQSERALIFVRGRVQGVGFRWWTRSQALERGLVGYARNMSDGRVEVCAQGARPDIEALTEALDPQAEVPRRPGEVTGLTIGWHPPREDLQGFLER